MKTEKQEQEIENIERAIFDMRSERKQEPIFFNSPEVHELAEKGEFYLISGSMRTLGGRIPSGVGMAYGLKTGLVIAKSQQIADDIVREINREPKKETLTRFELVK